MKNTSPSMELADLISQLSFTEERADYRESTHWKVYAHPWPCEEEGVDVLITIIPRSFAAAVTVRELQIFVHSGNIIWPPNRLVNRMRGEVQVWFERLLLGKCFTADILAEGVDHASHANTLISEIDSEPEGEERYGSTYWWVQYRRGNLMRLLCKYDIATPLLEEVHYKTARKDFPVKDLSVSALHKLGVVDFELGDLEPAEEKFNECLERRSKDEFNHRRAFEYRRLGQVYALTDRFEKARDAFDETIAISRRCAYLPCVKDTQRDITIFLEVPRYLMAKKPETILLSQLANQFGIDESSFTHSFRILSQKNQGYLEVIDAESAKPTGEAVGWDIAHSKGYWHASVTVLIVDHQGHIALQRRRENDSRGKWDALVAGHQDVGESDILAAARESREALGITVGAQRLIRIGKPYEFRKEGSLSVDCDRHESPTSYVYRTDKTNRERVNVFIVKLKEEEKKQIKTTGGAQAVKWMSLSEALERAKSNPDQFTSAFKLLAHDVTFDRINLLATA